MELAGKSALVTGAGSGIGAGIAQALVEHGVNVVLADIELERAKAEAGPLGKHAMALKLDVTSLESWGAAREAALARFGQIDVLCNNAGVAPPMRPLDEIAPDQFARIFAVNVTGVYHGVRTFAPDMRARRSGHIVNTSSLNGLVPYANFATYCASKFAVTGLSDSLRAELAPHGVGVSVMFPGLTRSRMSAAVGPPSSADPAVRAAIEARTMEPIWLGRAVARAIADNAQYIVTHPNHKADVEARHAELLAAFGAPAQPGYMGAET